MKSFLVCLIAIFTASASDDSYLKSCPKVNVIKPFEVNKFLGVWYQFAISGDLFNNPCEKSVTADWALRGGSKNITITTYRVCSKGMICRRKQTIWKAELGEPDEKTGQVDGKLNLTVNQPDFGKATVDLLILNTDYAHSAVLYTCSVISNRTMAIWILTRKQKPTDMEMADILTTVDATLETNHLDQFEFRLTNLQCESVVKNNSKAEKHINDKLTITEQKSPLSSTNASTTNTADNSGNEPNSSNTKSVNENIKSKHNTPLSSELNHNKTLSLVPKPNDPSPTGESLPKQIPTNGSFTKTGSNKTLNSNFDLLANSNGKVDQKNHSSTFKNSITQNLTNNSVTNNKVNKTLHNIADVLTSSNSKVQQNSHELFSVKHSVLQKPSNDSVSNNHANKIFNNTVVIISSSKPRVEQKTHELPSVKHEIMQTPSNDSATNNKVIQTFTKTVVMPPSSNRKERYKKQSLYSVIKHLQKSTNDSFTNNRTNTTFNSDSKKLSDTKDKEKSDKNVLYSVLENLLTKMPGKNNTVSKRLFKRNKNGKLSKHKLNTFQSEQNMLHSLPQNSHEDNPKHDSYSHNGLSDVGYSGNNHNGTKDLQQDRDVQQERDKPNEGFFPSLARQSFFKYIPKAFNIDFWRI